MTAQRFGHQERRSVCLLKTESAGVLTEAAREATSCHGRFQGFTEHLTPEMCVHRLRGRRCGLRGRVQFEMPAVRKAVESEPGGQGRSWNWRVLLGPGGGKLKHQSGHCHQSNEERGGEVPAHAQYQRGVEEKQPRRLSGGP